MRNHPELKDAQISRLVGTTKNTIEQIRNRTHWNSANLQPVDPVALGLCSQINLDFEVQKAAKHRPPEAAEPSESLLPAAETENLPVDDILSRPPTPKEEEELDAEAVFAKLSSLKGSQSEEAEEGGDEQ